MIYINQKKKKNQLTIIFILLGIGNILIWLKQEGIVFFMFLIFSAIIFNHLINKKNKLILVTSCFLLILLRVLILQILDVPFVDTEWQGSSENLYFDFQEFYYRTTKILFYTFVYIVQNPIYLISLPLMIISIKILKNNPLNKTLLLFTFIVSGFIFGVFFFQAMETIFILRNSMNEVLNSFSGVYLLVISNLINKYLSSN